jgi:Spy/CpxP family protein refolding chaperone
MSGRALLRIVSAAAVVLAVMSVQEASAQGRRGMGMFGNRGVNPLQTVALEGVQKELGLSQEKIDKIKDLVQDQREEFTQELTATGIDLRGLQDATKEEREKAQKQMAEVTKKVNDKFMPKLNEILDKPQQTRLHELAIQAAGAGALQDPDVSKSLALSKDQSDKLASINKEFGEKIRGLGRNREGLTEIQEEHVAKATEVLTPDQQKKFKEMKGKLVDAKILRPAMRGNRRRQNN